MLEEMTDFLRTRGKAVLGLAAANILVFIWLSLKGSTLNTSFMLEHGACYTPLILEGEYYRLFTGMFLHFGLVHLLYNMVCLVALGDLLEKEAGTLRFLAIYLLGGVAGNVLSLALDLQGFRGGYAVSAGASGAVFAVIGALLYLAVRRGSRIDRNFTKRLAVVTVLMIAQGFVEAGTDNAAHIGGVAAGFILCAVLTLRRNNRNGG